MARKEMGVWGIDLGQCALKALRLQEIDGQLTATAFDYVEHPKILSQPDADPDALTREALEKFLSRNSLRGDMVAISVPGQSGLARFVKLPPVEEKKINDIVRFEAKQQIPFNLEEVVWDYQKIGSGVVTDGFAMETEIGLFAMKRDMIGRYLQHFKDVKVEVHVVQMAPLALCNFVAYDLLLKGAPGEEPPPAEGEEAAPPSKTKNCVVALDIGADSSNLIITDGERIIWQRPIPLGGNHFTRALTKDLKLTFAKAEHLKRNATKSPDLKKILAALKPVLNDFVGEVQRSLGYFTNTHRDAHVDYLVGLGNAFRLPGLQRFLAEKLQLDVRKLAKLERLGGEVLNSPTYTDNVLGFAVAYGLAVQGLRHARLVTNLLPGEIRIERMVRAKKPWAVTAAACLMVTSGAMALDNFLEYRAYADPVVVSAEEKANATVKRVSDNENDFKKTKSKAQAEEQAVRSIVAGQAERLNWLKVTKFLGELIPQPDGVNFPPQFHTQYWSAPPEKKHADEGGMTGKKAYEEYKRRQDGLGASLTEAGVSPDIDELGRGIDDLILFNIERVDCRYAEDLAGFWEKVRSNMQDSRRENVRPMSEWDKPPSGKGWVFELRGYTYHYKRAIFVLDGLLENIARVGDPEASAPAEAPPDAAGNAAAGGAAAPKAGTAAPPAAGAAAPTPAGAAAKAGAAPPPAGGAAGAAAKAGAAAPAKGAADVKALEAECLEPPKIHHVVLFQTTSTPVSGTEPGASTLGTVLDGLIGAPGGGAAPAGGGRPGLGGIEIAAAGQWTPLLGTAASGATFDAGPAVTRRFRARGPGAAPAAPAAGTPAPAPEAAEGPQHWRTDFVVLFIWQEPTPSDSLRPRK